MTNDEDIFAEDYGKGTKKPEPEPKKESPDPDDKKSEKITFGADDPEPKKEVNKEEKIPRKEAIKPTVGKAKVVGISVISVVIAVIVIMATGVIEINIPESLITTPSQEKVSVGQESDEEPFKEVSSATDPVNIVPVDGIAGYFMVSSCCNWYGDFVDMGKVPKKIENAGNTKVNFICFNDEHLETQTYFGTFKNVLDPFLKVDVFINGKEVQSKTTNSGSALIVEGSCLGNES